MTEPLREPWPNLVWYHLFKWSVVSPLLYSAFQGKMYGAERVPRTGPLVVVSNHASDFDPPIVSICVGRPVAFMAKEELFRVPVLREAIRLYGAYPVKRGAGDRAALKASLALLAQGWACGVFLDGTRSPDGRVVAPKLGAALIAAKAQVPLLPVCLWGTHALLPKGARWPRWFSPVTVRIGEVLPPPASTERRELEAVSQRCAEVLNGLHALGR